MQASLSPGDTRAREESNATAPPDASMWVPPAKGTKEVASTMATAQAVPAQQAPSTTTPKLPPPTRGHAGLLMRQVKVSVSPGNTAVGGEEKKARDIPARGEEEKKKKKHGDTPTTGGGTEQTRPQNYDLLVDLGLPGPDTATSAPQSTYMQDLSTLRSVEDLSALCPMDLNAASVAPSPGSAEPKEMLRDQLRQLAPLLANLTVALEQYAGSDKQELVREAIVEMLVKKNGGKRCLLGPRECRSTSLAPAAQPVEKEGPDLISVGSSPHSRPAVSYSTHEMKCLRRDALSPPRRFFEMAFLPRPSVGTASKKSGLTNNTPGVVLITSETRRRVPRVVLPRSEITRLRLESPPRRRTSWLRASRRTPPPPRPETKTPRPAQRGQAPGPVARGLAQAGANVLRPTAPSFRPLPSPERPGTFELGLGGAGRGNQRHYHPPGEWLRPTRQGCLDAGPGSAGWRSLQLQVGRCRRDGHACPMA